MLHLVLMTAAFCVGVALPANAQTPIETHDNSLPAGELRERTLRIRLYAGLGTWRPEGDNGPALTVQAFGEEGQGLRIPGPLVRLPAGTTIEASLRNSLDVPLELHGFAAQPMKSDEAIVIAPLETHRLTFTVTSPGTYHYWATTTHAERLSQRYHIDSQLSGAFVVDDSGVVADRIFVTTLWSEKRGAVGLKPSDRVNFLINGRAWPHTSRLTYDLGTDVRWRVINLSDQPHPMHLHGFYFTVLAASNGPAQQPPPTAPGRRGVTELVRPGGTLDLAWTADRPGNWLFHCHIVEHITPYLSVAGSTSDAANHSHAGGGMGGMVIGITVRPRERIPAVATQTPSRRFTLTMKTVAKRFGLEEGYGFAIDRAPVAITPGPPLVLTRGEAAEITLVNELPVATAIHWHGMELESYFDGVPGFSGIPGSVTPSIPPGGRFDVRFTPPRSGTFIYHTHSHDLTSLQKGLYGALIVLEPGQKYDAETDHVWILGVNGSERGAAGEKDEALLNGTLTPTIPLKAGVPNRIRLINITANRTGLTFFVMKGTDVATWQLLAKDGADVPPSQRTIGRARQQVSVGETYDFELVPTEEMKGIEVRRGGGGETLLKAPIVLR